MKTVSNKSLGFKLKGLMLFLMAGCLMGCEKEPVPGESFEKWEESSDYIKTADESVTGSKEVPAEEATAPAKNPESSLSVPTYINKIDDNWFIVDCYHNRIIYNDNLQDPLNQWNVLTEDVDKPHTMAGDGTVILVDDTENNRVLVFERTGNTYARTQVFNDIGQRPHYTVYDDVEKAFYVWSSTTGEMYVFRHHADDSSVYLTEIRKIEELSGTYIRSFYLDGNDIYFVSGIAADGTSSGILKCDKRTLKVKKKFSVPDTLAGMAAMGYANGYYFITVSTDVTGNQDAATIIRAKSLEGLAKGEYEDIYATYFVGGGTPYNFYQVDGTYYLTEHRLPAHAIWSFRIGETGDIKDVLAMY